MKKLTIIFITTASIVFCQLQFEKEIIPKFVSGGVQLSSIAVSKFDDIYLLDGKFHEIYKIDDSGIVQKKNGGFGWGQCQLDTPSDIAVSSGLDIIVADFNNHRLTRYDRYLNFVSTFPNPGSNVTIPYPLSVIVSDMGELFVLEEENSEVVRFNVLKNVVSQFAGIEYGKYSLIEPIQIRLSQKGSLFVLEKIGRLLQFDRFGTFIKEIKPPEPLLSLGMILIGENILILNQSEPTLFCYLSNLDEWIEPVIIGYDKKHTFISGSAGDQKVYLLTSAGSIVICNTKELNY